LFNFFNEGAECYQRALELIPSTSIIDRGIIHNQLGYLFRLAGDIDRALQHYGHSIRYHEQAGDIFGAGETRFNVALALLRAERFDDARDYSEAAMANFRQFGDRGAERIHGAQQLIAIISERVAEQEREL
jgi:tetratricopeptide (TPR) repeat protein